MKTKVCSKCKRRKYLDKFHRHSSGKDGRAPTCGKCHTIEVMEYRKFGCVISGSKKNQLPQLKTIKRHKRNIKSKKYVNSAIDKLAYCIADAIMKQKYGVDDLSEIKEVR